MEESNFSQRALRIGCKITIYHKFKTFRLLRYMYSYSYSCFKECLIHQITLFIRKFNGKQTCISVKSTKLKELM